MRVCQHSSVHATRNLPGLAITGAVVAAAYALNHGIPSLSPLSLSVVLGVIVANVVRMPEAAGPGVHFSGRRLMRLGVALLGMEVSIRSLLGLGWSTIAAVLVVVTVTILGVAGLAQLLGLERDFGLLIGVGYGICGASAVAAAKSQTRTTEEQASYAVALVALCGTLSIAILPVLGAIFGLGDLAFGRWAGAAVHDVGQVVATASTRSNLALHAAIVVKLARVAMLAPVVLLLSLRARRLQLHVGTTAKRPPLLPLFVVSFLILSVVNSINIVPAPITSFLVNLAQVSMAFGLAALGLNVRWRELRAVGGRPLVLGLLAWVLVAAVALIVVLITVGR